MLRRANLLVSVAKSPSPIKLMPLRLLRTISTLHAT